MYVIPIVILVVLALIAVGWSPIFALIIFVPAFIAFLAYEGLAKPGCAAGERRAKRSKDAGRPNSGRYSADRGRRTAQCPPPPGVRAGFARPSYVGMSRRADEKITPPQAPNAGPSHEDDTDTGLWGERRPS